MTSRSRRDRGAVIPIVALLLPVLILMTAFAVDLGRLRSSRRTMQARADAVALDLVRLSGTKSWGGIIGDVGYQPYITESAERNDVERSKLNDPVWGMWDPTNGFQPCTVLANCRGAGTLPTAVKVTATEPTDYFFQPGSGHVSRSAVATTDRQARLKLGSFAARLASGSSPLLRSVLGDALNTTVAGYEGLISSDIDLGLLQAALNLGSATSTLGTDVTMAQLLHASATALRNDPSSDSTDIANAQLLDTIGTSVTGVGSVALGDIVGAETGGADAALVGTINAFDLFSAAALVANGSSALAVPNLSLNLGLLQVGTPCNGTPSDDTTEVCSALSVIQSPVIVKGHIGTSKSTSQARARLGATGGIPGLASATTQLDVSLASSTATIQNVTCGAPRTVTAGVTTGLADASVRITGTVSVSVLGVGLLAIPVVIGLDRAPSTSSESVTFTEVSPGVFTPSKYEAGSQDLGLSGFAPVVTMDLSGVLSGFRPAVTAAANLVLAPILTLVSGPLLAALQAAVQPLLNQLGFNLAGADLSALEARCDLAALVE